MRKNIKDILEFDCHAGTETRLPDFHWMLQWAMFDNGRKLYPSMGRESRRAVKLVKLFPRVYDCEARAPVHLTSRKHKQGDKLQNCSVSSRPIYLLTRPAACDLSFCIVAFGSDYECIIVLGHDLMSVVYKVGRKMHAHYCMSQNTSRIISPTTIRTGCFFQIHTSNGRQ